MLLVMMYRLRNSILFLMVLAGLCAVAPNCLAQSSEQALPTPILTNEITGKIKPLDLGDARLTRHYYAFEGSPGDLLITIDSKNLNGDIDVFTAITFRPLMKTTVYASSQSPEVAKGIYLRAHQILILRVEARTPSDEPGAYHIRFGGTFERFSSGIPVAEASTAESEEAADKGGANRLSSVGATIPRPATEKTETVETAEAKPSPSPEIAAEKPSEETAPAKKPTSSTSRRTTSRPPPRRGTRPTPSKPTTSAKKTETAKTETAKTETESSKTETEKPAEEKPAASEKSAETNPSSAKTTKTQEAMPAARLIIEEKDGTRIDRPMSTVRRVTIEGNAIVIILKTGKIERIAMADVARMSIEPQ